MDSSYPKDPTSIGEHIRKKIIELKLFQKDLADLFGVSEDFITSWENNRSAPQIHYYPALIRFLGYCPFELDLTTFEGRIKAYRYLHGWLVPTGNDGKWGAKSGSGLSGAAKFVAYGSKRLVVCGINGCCCGLSRKHFAKLMAVDPQTIVHWENGRGKRSKREKMERFLLKYDFNADYPTHPV